MADLQTIFLEQTFTCGSKITLIENDKTLSENHKIAKTFNMYFQLVTDSLNDWFGESVNSNDRVEQIIVTFSKPPRIR